MILDRHDINTTLQELETTNHTVNGWSMQGLKELANRYGLRAEGRRLDLRELSRRQLPAILFVEGHHFVVVDSRDSAGFFTLLDPAIGRMKIQGKSLAKIWKGETLVFGDSCNTKEIF
jgi:ABC-type bacteriocin/lantibiotic exporter with double-glycine peptidase domain